MAHELKIQASTKLKQALRLIQEANHLIVKAEGAEDTMMSVVLDTICSLLLNIHSRILR